MLSSEYDRKGSVAKQKQTNSDSDPQVAWHQDELIGGN
jgi:hypothetical protein